MPITPTKQILAEALKGNYGVGAYNVNNMEPTQAALLMIFFLRLPEL
ncbi:MAG: hypothetical protein NTV16_06150 [Actinobacteria bacterium]|nr:hypothetical protein [Actinomycetota bacterium]